MGNSLEKSRDHSQADRALLIELGRQRGLSDRRLSLALRAGSLANIPGLEKRSVGKPKQAPSLFSHARLREILDAFLEELDKTSWPLVTKDDILCRSRIGRYALPRQCVARLMREFSDASYPAIAAALYREDHTTIMHACKHAPEIERKHPRLAHVMAKVRERFAS